MRDSGSSSRLARTALAQLAASARAGLEQERFSEAARLFQIVLSNGRSVRPLQLRSEPERDGVLRREPRVERVLLPRARLRRWRRFF